MNKVDEEADPKTIIEEVSENTHQQTRIDQEEGFNVLDIEKRHPQNQNNPDSNNGTLNLTSGHLKRGRKIIFNHGKEKAFFPMHAAVAEAFNQTAQSLAESTSAISNAFDSLA